MFQNMKGETGDGLHSHVTFASLEERRRGRTTTSLVCHRAYFAASRGLCMNTATSHRLGDIVIGQPEHRTTITGPDFKPRHKLELGGIPSRARISPDGRYGATTVFVTGHSYRDDGYSTQTVIIDMERGKVLSDLEKDFTVTRNGKRIDGLDFNFWGVTFARIPGRFYATLGTRGTTYLLEGNVRTKRARMLRENVECPSISPDNTRLAYKKRVGEGWRLHVIDLDTMADTPLAEKRSVDDQVEWLDDDRVLYGLSRDTWIVPADGSGAPRKFLSGALSPAVIRN